MIYIKEFYNKYLNNEIKLNKLDFFGILCLIVVFSGVFGWIYEFIFYFFDQGMDKFYWQGGNFLPWINIYAIGALIVWFFTTKIKKKPLYVFLISIISTGLLELISGYIIYNVFHVRFWDYNVEILNFGNVGGFICLRSVLFFGISCLFLVYLVIPAIYYLATHMNNKLFLIISFTLFSLVMIDEIYNLIAMILNLPTSKMIYTKLGILYMN